MCIFFAGIFQIFALSFDQYIIQKESKLRIMKNEQQLLKDQMLETLTANISFGRFNFTKSVDARNAIFVIDNDEALAELRKQTFEIDDMLQLIISNNYLSIEKSYADYSKKDQFEDLFKKDLIDVRYKLSKLLSSYTDPLVDLYKSYFLTKTTLSNLRSEIKSAENLRGKLLVFGMISNILSILALFGFFYLSIGDFKLKNKSDGDPA